jgi:twinkle protein
MNMLAFTDYGIDVPESGGTERRTICPKCSAARRPEHQKERCLSINVEKATWLCNHCAWKGGLSRNGAAKVNGEPYESTGESKPFRKPDPRPHSPLPQAALDLLRARGITDEVIARNRIDYEAAVFFHEIGMKLPAIVFPYYRDGELLNRKYRAIVEKAFATEKSCEVLLYGVDDISAEMLVWTEGELDKLAIEVAGFTSVVSVPSGAPAPNAKTVNIGRFERDRARIEAVKHHVIAVDADAPGARLEAELVRRLGPGRCSRVKWPRGCKDANDVLMKHGAEDLRWFIEHAMPLPIEGALSVDELRDDVQSLYERGFNAGVSTGWTSVDALYTVRAPEVTVVTGIPSSGKSNVCDALLVNLAKLHNWSFAVFSPENLPINSHIAAIAGKYVGKPFHRGKIERMTHEELSRALDWIRAHFTWIAPSDESDWTIERILEIVGQLVLRRGIRGVLIDPWNRLESERPSHMSETEYIAHALKRIHNFAKLRGVAVWVVVHPTKLYRDDRGKYPVPTLYDCAGSAHWRNMSDNGLVVWRDLSENDSSEVEIHVQKIRFRETGRRGVARLLYEPVCATYRDKPRGNEEQ